MVRVLVVAAAVVLVAGAGAAAATPRQAVVVDRCAQQRLDAAHAVTALRDEAARLGTQPASLSRTVRIAQVTTDERVVAAAVLVGC